MIHYQEHGAVSDRIYAAQVQWLHDDDSGLIEVELDFHGYVLSR